MGHSDAYGMHVLPQSLRHHRFERGGQGLTGHQPPRFNQHVNLHDIRAHNFGDHANIHGMATYFPMGTKDTRGLHTKLGAHAQSGIGFDRHHRHHGNGPRLTFGTAVASAHIGAEGRRHSIPKHLDDRVSESSLTRSSSTSSDSFSTSSLLSAPVADPHHVGQKYYNAGHFHRNSHLDRRFHLDAIRSSPVHRLPCCPCRKRHSHTCQCDCHGITPTFCHECQSNIASVDVRGFARCKCRGNENYEARRRASLRHHGRFEEHSGGMEFDQSRCVNFERFDRVSHVKGVGRRVRRSSR